MSQPDNKTPVVTHWEPVLQWAVKNGLRVPAQLNGFIRAVNVLRRTKGEPPFKIGGAEIHKRELARKTAYNHKMRGKPTKGQGTTRVKAPPSLAPKMLPRNPKVFETVKVSLPPPPPVLPPDAPLLIPVGWRDAVNYAVKHGLKPFTGDLAEINRFRAKQKLRPFTLMRGRLTGLKF